MSAPRVAGLDLSMTSTGICLPDGTTRTVKTKDTDGDARLQTIVTEVGTALGEGDDGRHACDLVVLEEAPPGLKGAAIKAIHMVHGAVRLLLLDFGTPYAVINPTVLKGYATGDNRADKTALAMAAYKRAGIEFPGDKGGDQCDAWWLRQAGLLQLQAPEVTLPKAQRDLLTKVAWPRARR